MSQNVECVEYARRSTGINIHKNACDWNDFAATYGCVVSGNPTVGCVMCFEPGAYHAHPVYGHVAKVMSVRTDGSHLTIRVRHANWPSVSYFEDHGCGNVSEKTFIVKKGDKSVHFIAKSHTDPHKHSDHSHPSDGHKNSTEQKHSEDHKHHDHGQHKHHKGHHK